MISPTSYIYLASRSLRRRSLLKQIGVRYKILLMRETLSRPADIDETPLANETPTDYVNRIVGIKAEEGWKRLTQRSMPLQPVLVADTIVSIDGKIFGKPKDSAHAEEMLRTLSGRTHEVLTCIALTMKGRTETRLSTTNVKFREITDREIRGCVVGGKVFDKAGAYAIQGMAAAFISEITGSYSGVMGLPLFETAQILEESGIELFL